MNSDSNCPRENRFVSLVQWMPGVLRISLGLIMTLEADNLYDGGIALRFRLVNGWFVISMDWGKPFRKRAEKFYRKFGMWE